MTARIKITSDECRSCGACCIGESPIVLDYGYADMTQADVDQVSRHVRRQLHDQYVGGERRYATPAKEIAEGVFGCRYLRGTPGERCSCRIYATRPEICRDFKVDGLICRQARAAMQKETP